MEDGAGAGAATRLDVGRAPDDDAGERQAAHHAGEEVADALGAELAVGGRVPPERIELVGGLERQERLEARHQGDGGGHDPDLRLQQHVPPGQRHLTEEAGDAAHRHLHQLVTGELARGPEPDDDLVADGAEHHHDQRTGDALQCAEARVVPEKEDAPATRPRAPPPWD